MTVQSKRGTAAELEEVTPAGAPHPCGSCPLRSTSGSAFGYCEGCTRATRQCRCCQQNKPQSGWGWGLLFGGMVGWVCADCKARTEPDVESTHPRFVADLAIDASEDRWKVADLLASTALNTGVSGAVDPAAMTLARMAKAIREAPAAGPIALDVDLSDVPLEYRRSVLGGVQKALGSSRGGEVSATLQKLLHRWVEHLSECDPAPEPPRTESLGETSRRVNREVWSSPDGS